MTKERMLEYFLLKRYIVDYKESYDNLNYKKMYLRLSELESEFTRPYVIED